MYKNILLPTDGSPLSRVAILAGVEVAAKLGARVTAFYAAPAAKNHLDVVERAAKAARVRCDGFSVVSDCPADAILAAAKKHKCDLIVIAPHGRKGLSALLLGSQTQKVLANAKVPVLVHR